MGVHPSVPSGLGERWSRCAGGRVWATPVSSFRGPLPLWLCRRGLEWGHQLQEVGEAAVRVGYNL